MKHTIPTMNWITALSDLIRDCADGDTIVVANDSQRALGQRVRVRMCPEKNITFEVETQDPWIATTNMLPIDKRPGNKPSGMWRCRACQIEQHGSTLYQDPMYTAEVWTCSDLTCGGVCDPVK